MSDLPRYRCHKEVRAARIDYVALSRKDGSAMLYFLGGVPPRAVSAGYMAKHNPTDAGYFVEYEDGYTSFSPADVFEAGYTKIEA